MKLSFQNLSKHTLSFFTLIVGATISINQILFLPWPYNHEMESFFRRTLIYADHLKNYDFFPIWSGADNLNHGGPFPLFYHKLFYYFSGIFFNLLKSNQESIVVTIIAFLIIGSFFIYLLIFDITGSRYLGVFGGLLLIFSNYTHTNWFIRGAMAEFSAAMLFPFLLYIIYHFFSYKRYSFSLGLILGLLFLAHSSVAFYVYLVLAPVIIFFLFKNKLLKDFIKITLGFGILIMPYVLLINTFRKDFNLSNILIYRPQDELIPISKYLWDPEYVFGEPWDAYTVVLGNVISLLIIVVLIYMMFVLENLNLVFSNYFTNYLIISVVLYLTLQLPIAMNFYLYFPGAQYLQFPWRLLSLIVPILIILLVSKLGDIFNVKFLFAVVTIFLGVHLYFAPNFKSISSPRLDTNNIKFDRATLWFSENTGAYFPKGLMMPSTNSYDSKFLDAYQKGCTVKNHLINNNDISRSFKYNCTKNEEVVLPLIYSQFHQAEIVGNGTFQKFPVPISNKEGFITISLPRGSGVLNVYHPTLLNSLRILIFRNTV